MATSLPVITPRERRPGGCCVAPVEPDLEGRRAVEIAAVVKALADPTRLRIVDVVRKAAPAAVCQCELLPLFEMSQPALSKHLKVLTAAGVLGAEKRGLWTYYYDRPEGREELIEWLS
jgi:ArsR family transcriptional regulator, arsenate/arsenite/antimonite-responsive transcriptional repressor